ncbi:hypothetical protein GCM10023083_21890 [Streptomyces phyllanthi]
MVTPCRVAESGARARRRRTGFAELATARAPAAERAARAFGPVTNQSSDIEILHGLAHGVSSVLAATEHASGVSKTPQHA